MEKLLIPVFVFILMLLIGLFIDFIEYTYKGFKEIEWFRVIFFAFLGAIISLMCLI